MTWVIFSFFDKQSILIVYETEYYDVYVSFLFVFLIYKKLFNYLKYFKQINQDFGPDCQISFP